MNKRQLGYIFVSITLILVLIVLTIFKLVPKNSQIEKETSETEPTVQLGTTSYTDSTLSSETNSTPLYILGEWEGKLALFQYASAETPLKTYDVYLSSLPAEEQQRLKNGILISDDLTLQKLLEDYTS